MENFFLLTLLFVGSCQIGISSVALPNLENETHGEDDNQLERVELPNLMNETHGEDDNPVEREHVLPIFLNMTHEEEKNQLGSEDESNMMNETQGLDEFQQQRSNRSTRIAHTYTGYLYLDGGYWGGWGAGEYCPFPHIANKMELKIQTDQGHSGDDTALNAIRLTCTNGQTITSAQSGWGTWRGVKSCSSNNYIKNARIRKENTQGGGDDSAANGITFICTDGQYGYPGDGYKGSYQSWQSCPSGSAVYGIQTQIQHDQGGGDDTALNDVRLTCARIPACSGYTYQWSCCTPSSPCGFKQGDCDTDSDCSGSLICGTDNCKSFNSLADTGTDCCIKPRCSGYDNQWACCTPSSPCGFGQGDCDTDSDCSGSLICGKNGDSSSDNCKSFDSLAESTADCCVKPPIHGGWSSWGSCSKSCRYGTSYGYQYRSCTNPRPQHGGRSCSGSSYLMCNVYVCCPDNSGRMAKQTTYFPTPTKSCPILPEPTPCPTTTCPPIPTCPLIPTCPTNSTIGSTPSKTVITKPPATPSCKPSKKCEKKNGKCFGKGDTVPKHAKRKGWCSKKTNCKCYEV